MNWVLVIFLSISLALISWQIFCSPSLARPFIKYSQFLDVLGSDDEYLSSIFSIKYGIASSCTDSISFFTTSAVCVIKLEGKKFSSFIFARISSHI